MYTFADAIFEVSFKLTHIISQTESYQMNEKQHPQNRSRDVCFEMNKKRHLLSLSFNLIGNF